MVMVETVRGPVDVRSLGPTLMHEHIVNVTHEVAHDYPHLSWPEPGRHVARSAGAAAPSREGVRHRHGGRCDGVRARP